MSLRDSFAAVFNLGRHAVAIQVIGFWGILHSLSDGQSVDTLAKENLLYTEESSGLPAFTSPFHPSHSTRPLKETDLRERIDAVFSALGYSLAQDYLYQLNDISVRLHGWDEERKTGYIFANYRNLERGCVRSHRGPWYSDDSFDIDTLPNSLRRRAEIALNQVDRDDRLVALDRLVLLKTLITCPTQLAIQELRDAYPSIDVKDLDPIEEVLWIENWDERLRAVEPRLDQVAKKLGESRLSMKELRLINARSEESGDYIAIISAYDRRFHIQYDPKHERELLSIENKEERSLRSVELWNQSTQEALGRVEEAVRGYLSR